jgi:hypothetical protein
MTFLLRMIRDWRRGYSDDDLKSAQGFMALVANTSPGFQANAAYMMTQREITALVKTGWKP